MAVIAALSFISCFLLASCGKAVDIGSMEYCFDTDMQYYQTTENNKTSIIQETADGCCLYHNGFVYRYSRSDGKIVPLCNKVNCLHDRETDSEKLNQCNAYLENLAENGKVVLMLYQNKLYVCYERGDWNYASSIKYPYTLYSLPIDGSSRDQIYTGSDILYPMIHRGYMYYYSTQYVSEEEGVNASFAFLRINIEKKNIKPELLYTPEKALQSIGGYIQGYGKYVYFDSYMDGNASETGSSNASLARYDITTGKIQKIDFVHTHPAFYNGRLYGRAPKEGADVYNAVDVMSSDPDGANTVSAVKDIYQGSFVVSDGKYLYVNTGIIRLPYPEQENFFWVYDSDMNKVDEFTLPDTYSDRIDPPIGGEKYQYLLFEDNGSGEWGIYVWDKSEIGTLHGKVYTQQRIVY